MLLDIDPVSDAIWYPVSLSRGEDDPVDEPIPSSAWKAGDRRALRTAIIFILSCSDADCRAPVEVIKHYYINYKQLYLNMDNWRYWSFLLVFDIA